MLKSALCRFAHWEEVGSSLLVLVGDASIGVLDVAPCAFFSSCLSLWLMAFLLVDIAANGRCVEEVVVGHVKLDFGVLETVSMLILLVLGTCM